MPDPGGLGAMATVEAVVDMVQAAPLVEHNVWLPPDTPPFAFVGCDGGMVSVAVRYPEMVRLYLMTEAGRISIVDIDPRDAASASAALVAISR
jgi:hypothetical protein